MRRTKRTKSKNGRTIRTTRHKEKSRSTTTRRRATRVSRGSRSTQLAGGKAWNYKKIAVLGTAGILGALGARAYLRSGSGSGSSSGSPKKKPKPEEFKAFILFSTLRLNTFLPCDKLTEKELQDLQGTKLAVLNAYNQFNNLTLLQPVSDDNTSDNITRVINTFNNLELSDETIYTTCTSMRNLLGAFVRERTNALFETYWRAYYLLEVFSLFATRMPLDTDKESNTDFVRLIGRINELYNSNPVQLKENVETILESYLFTKCTNFETAKTFLLKVAETKYNIFNALCFLG